MVLAQVNKRHVPHSSLFVPPPSFPPIPPVLRTALFSFSRPPRPENRSTDRRKALRVQRSTTRVWVPTHPSRPRLGPTEPVNDRAALRAPAHTLYPLGLYLLVSYTIARTVRRLPPAACLEYILDSVTVFPLAPIVPLQTLI